MSITKAMWTGVSGLGAEGSALGVIGDNIANGNTVGFKASRALFEDILGGAIGSNVGGGVRMARAQQIFAQGSIVNTGQATDLAISGDGFFVVKGSLGGVTGDFYSRAGQFTPDNQGFLVNPQGLKLQGYLANPDGTFQTTATDLQLPTAPIPASASTKFSLDGNLDPSATPPVLPWNPADAANTSNAHSSTDVVDSLGNKHTIDIYYVKTAAGWDYHAVTEGADLAGGTPGPTEIGSGSLTFGTSGELTGNTTTVPIAPSFVGASPSQPITIDLGTPTPGGTGMDGLTASASVTPGSTAVATGADGYAQGLLTGVKIDPDGTVMGSYDNGEQLAIGQVVTAKFASNDGLDRAGGNCWVKTRESGDPVVGAPGSGGRGSLVAGALEQSNVDIAEQFVRMISHQRSFQANSKTITTADEMLQEVVNLKR